jgi:L-threonylcarbamoyladenylate synthase
VTDFEFFTVTDGDLLSFGDAERIVDLLRKGGLAVLPTETGYMVAADATNTTAVEKVFRAKQRSISNPMHVACSSLAMARRVSKLTPAATELLMRYTPGPLTVVVEQTPRLPSILVTLNGTVGIRVPDHAATLQVVEALGVPVTATSLNRSGEEGMQLERKQLTELDWLEGDTIAVVEDPTSITQPAPSTLVRLTNGIVEILRHGPVSEQAIRESLGIKVSEPQHQ